MAAEHRVGPLGIGDLAVVVAVSCAHRGDAFEAARLLIDRVKSEVPIWKWQQFADGTSEWVSCTDEPLPAADGVARGRRAGTYAWPVNVRFDILAWLLVPLAVTLLALLWVGWRARPKGPADAQDGMADLLRFREAMSKPLPGAA